MRYRCGWGSVADKRYHDDCYAGRQSNHGLQIQPKQLDKVPEISIQVEFSFSTDVVRIA